MIEHHSSNGGTSSRHNLSSSGRTAAYRVDYPALLNSSQLEAVMTVKGPVLVIAGAGSGKTRTLTYRVARLVESGVNPSSILLLSFTRKASHEMLQRATHLLDRRCRQVSGGTFHSFANSILRRYAPVLGFDRGFSILDRSDTEDLIGMIRKEFGPAKEVRGLPRKSTLATMFSRSVNKGLDLEDVVYDDYPHFTFQLEEIKSIWHTYQARKKEHHFCDYDDLLTFLYQLISQHDDICEALSSAYSHIMVDEYQDTNMLQADIVSLLAGDRQNVMVVGDDSQSIYAFRGANFKNIITFPQRFPGTRIIKLEENYRSVQPILDLTNALIDQAAEKFSKRLFTRRQGGSMPALVGASSENAQSDYIVKEIHRRRRQGVPLSHMAVLFRASFHAFDLELELNRAAIPFVKVGGFRFMEAAHIKDVLAHLKLFATADDRLSWYRVLLLIEKIGPKTAQRIYSAVINENNGPAGLLSATLNIKASEGLQRLKKLIATLEALDGNVVRMGETAITYYLPILKDRYDDHPRRQKDLEQLLTIMERYDVLEEFLADMALEPPNTVMDNHMAGPESADADRLTLSTVHSAKGLEWDTVFVIWALDGRFPSIHALDNAENLEEELRLMYVATTRAKQRLYITYPVQVYDRTSGTMLYRPSRFLEGLADEVIDKQFFQPSK